MPGLLPATRSGRNRPSRSWGLLSIYHDGRVLCSTRHRLRGAMHLLNPRFPPAPSMQPSRASLRYAADRGLRRQMGHEWRWFRLRLLAAAGLKPPPAQKLPGHEVLKELARVSGPLRLDDKPTSYKVEVLVAGETNWSANAMRYPTHELAEAAAKDLISRWMAVKEWRVLPTQDPPNVEAKR